MFGINTNIGALAAAAKLNANYVEQATAMQRLSTGVRVNSAKDDAASLAIGTGFTAKTRGMQQALRNTQDGISLAQTAESALSSAVNMVQRMRELALQSSNGTLTDTNRKSLQLEFDALVNEINNTLKASNFNGIKLFDGSSANIKIQTGINANETKSINIPQTNSLNLLGVAGSEALNGGQVNLPPEVYVATTNQVYTGSNTNNYTDSVYVDPNIVVNGVGNIDGASITISNADAAHDLLSLANPSSGITATYTASTGILKLSGTASVAAYQEALRNIKFKTDSTATTGTRNFNITLGTAVQGPNGHYYYYVDTKITYKSARDIGNSTQYFGMQGYVATVTSSAENTFITNYIPNDVWISGSDGYNEINSAVGGTLFRSQTASEGKWYIIDGPEKGQRMTYTSWLAGEPNNTRLDDPNGEQFLILTSKMGYPDGAWIDLNNNAFFNNFKPGILVEYDTDPNLHLTASTTIDVGGNWHPAITTTPTPEQQIIPDITTRDNASASLKKLDNAIGILSNMRAYLGAVQNTLAASGENLTSSITNSEISKSRIMDTDYTITTTELSRFQIITQASTAILAQANQIPQLVMQLIKNT